MMDREQKEYGKENRLLDLLGRLPDDMLDEAVTYQKPVTVRRQWNKSGLLAACLCAVLLGSLVWDSLYDENGPGLETTAADVISETTTVSTGSVPTGTAESTGGAPAETLGREKEGFWYAGKYYVPAEEVVLTELPEGSEYLGILYWIEESIANAANDWQTESVTLAGCEVYLIEDQPGFLVGEKDGYQRYVVKEQSE